MTGAAAAAGKEDLVGDDFGRVALDAIALVGGCLESALDEVDTAAGKALEPIQARARVLTTMPGVSDIVAHVIVAEIGVDMSRFPTAGHLVSWAGLCPRNDESAGKRRSTRVRKSANWLKTTLVTAAWAAVRKKESYLRAQFLRIKSRRGAKKAILASGVTDMVDYADKKGEFVQQALRQICPWTASGACGGGPHETL